MELLKQKILKEGKIREGNVLKVDSFLNHQMDVKLFKEIGYELKKRFADVEINKILTIESSGIGIACIVAEVFDVPVLFAKKSESKNLDKDVYVSSVRSYTKGRVFEIRVAKEYLNEGDKVLVIDDFLANGAALKGLFELIKESGAELVGAGICIEKGYQPGGKMLREDGYRIESLAIVDEMDEKTGIKFRE